MVPVEGILKRVSGLANELSLANLQPQIAACRNQLEAGDGIDVAVFGRFKAGKSSFLNSLAGRTVLPIGVVPLTAVVTRLRYGPAEKAEVRFLNGTAKAVSLQEIGVYVGEDANPGNEKQVASVDVELPALQVFEPLQFVDTPGLGSAFTHNTQVTLQWLPNVGAALVAASCDAPLSERDLALLAELRQHTPRIVLLLTKADLLTEAQRAEVMGFVRRELRRKWDGELPVFFYSVRPGFGGLNEKLMRELLLPLAGHHAEAGQGILRHKLQSLADRTLDYLRVGLAAAMQADSSRQTLKERLEAERRDFDLLREELSVLARQWSAAALETSLARLHPNQAALQERAAAELKQRFSEWRLRLPALLEAWRGWLQGYLVSELTEVSRTQRPMFCEPLHRAEQHLARTLQGFQDRLRGHVKTVLGVALAQREIELQVQEHSAPPVDVGYAFDVACGLAAHVIPLWLFRRPIGRALARKTRWEVEKNLSRLAAAWRDRVAAGICELVRQAERQAAGELSALERMLAQRQSNEPMLRRALKEAESVREALRAA
jgi:GTP-binding protein EngB required for normal cell division